MKKYVYLIQSEETGRYKIGISKHPSKRIKQLQTGSSEKLRLVEQFESNYPNKVEKSLHIGYNYLKTYGEWFELDLEQELSFISDCERIETNIDLLKNLGNEFV